MIGETIRVAYLAAGAGGMICGSCLRDNRIAATLIDQGRDVVLIPLYTPLTTDEPDVSIKRVYYGGINIYLQQWSRLLGLALRPAARLLDSSFLLKMAMRPAGDADPGVLGRLTVSVLEGAHGAQRRALAELLTCLRELAPDVVVLPNLMFVGIAEPIRAALGAPVLCTLSGEDIFLDRLVEPHKTRAFELIARESRHLAGFVAVTNYYADHASDHFDLPRDRVHVVPLGVNVDDFSPPLKPPAEPFTIGYLARICPEKGLDMLVEAFVELRRRGRSCRLRVAGYLGRRDEAYLERVRAFSRERGVDDEIDFVGEVDLPGKRTFLQSLHVLCVPTTYPEAKGFYVLEAMACGVPVVQPSHGSFPELVEATQGGLLYDPADSLALADTMVTLMEDGDLSKRLGAAGRQAVCDRFTAGIMAEKTWTLCERIRAEGVSL